MQNYKFDEVNHIHLLNDKPLIGASSMASVLSKPLTWWSAGLAVEKLGWMNKGNAQKGWAKKEDRIAKASQKKKEIAEMGDEEYLKLLDTAYAAHSVKLKDTASDGTDMHAIMEEYIKACINNNNGVPINLDTNNEKLKILIDWALLKVKRFIWSEVYCYSEELWLGGISDCGFEDKDGNYAVLDFKSSKDVYLSQFWQCIGYAMLLESSGGLTKDGELLFKLEKDISYVAVLPFGMDKPEVKYYYDMEGGAEAVRAMVLLYKKLNV